MKAAVVHQFDRPPRYGDFPDPSPAGDEVRVRVTAAALSQLTRARASGKHYSSGTALPFVPGVDGVGRLDDGRRVYFLLPADPYGSMGQLTRVARHACVPLPDEIDDVTMAALAIPAMSSWAALTERARLTAGETVLVNGATGTSGRLAVQIAKHLGAGRVIATGRNPAVLATLAALGADEVISLGQSPPALAEAFGAVMGRGVDAVLDYLWGPSAEQVIAAVTGHGAARAGRRVRFVQIGSIAGPTIAMPAAVLRSSGLELMGSGIGSVSTEALLGAIAAAARAAGPARLQVETQPVPLEQVEATWNASPGTDRIVYTVR